jgi:DNA-binding CsgD family transcriptional regulator
MNTFDQYQFDKKSFAITANTRISWNDYERMQTGKAPGMRRNRKWIPAWALNDLQFRHVLAQRCWNYSQMMGRKMVGKVSIVPDELVSDRIALGKLVDDVVPLMKAQLRKLGAEQARNRDVHLAMRMRIGYLDLQCSIAYRAYRLEESSTQIGAALGISPNVVRVHLERLNRAAETLGYETHVKHWTRHTKKKHTRVHVRGFDWERAAKLRSAGKYYKEIASELGVNVTAVGVACRKLGAKKGRPLVPAVPSEVQRNSGPGVAEPHEPAKALVAA